MKRLWQSGLSLLLGWWTTAAPAQEIGWHPLITSPPAAHSAQTPVAPFSISLKTPVALEDAAATLQPTLLTPSCLGGADPSSEPTAKRPVFRAQAEDAPAMPPPVWPEEPKTPAPLKRVQRGEVLPRNATLRPPPDGGTDPVCDDLPGCCPLGPALCSDGSGPRERAYLSAEYLLWWIRGDSSPPLVTTGTPASQAFLGQNGTQILFGGSLDQGSQSGGRFTAGVWLDSCQKIALEGSYFFLGQRSIQFRASSSVFPVLGRPFFDINQNQELAELTGFPQQSSGTISITDSSRLQGAEANLRWNCCCGCNYRFDVLAGFRFLQLDEGLHITEDVNVLATLDNSPVFKAGNHINVLDRFDTRNQFYGGQVGGDLRLDRGRWSLDVLGKLALGTTHQVIDINGAFVTTTPQGAQTVQRGGLLALPSNIGHFSRDHFSVAPEVGVKLGYRLTQRLRAFVGYDFLYWSNVVRPGAQIDRVLDITQIPNFVLPGVNVPPNPTGIPRPLVPFRETGVWAQGVTIGLEFRF
jgi:hypothetical protein